MRTRLPRSFRTGRCHTSVLPPTDPRPRCPAATATSSPGPAPTSSSLRARRWASQAQAGAEAAARTTGTAAAAHRAARLRARSATCERALLPSSSPRSFDAEFVPLSTRNSAGSATNSVLPPGSLRQWVGHPRRVQLLNESESARCRAWTARCGPAVQADCPDRARAERGDRLYR